MTLMLLAGMVQEAEHAGPASPFEVNFGLFIWTWAVFLLLLWLLKKFAFPAILKVTEEREQAIQRQLSDAEKANTEAKGLLEENRRQLAQARSEAQALIADAKAAAEKERAAALEKTRNEQEALLDRARRDIVEEREKAIADLRREAVDLSLAAAARLVEQRFDAEADRALVQGYINSLGKSN
jgi:F-type H+-transporting ATPase subunit b